MSLALIDLVLHILNLLLHDTDLVVQRQLLVGHLLFVELLLDSLLLSLMLQLLDLLVESRLGTQ